MCFKNLPVEFDASGRATLKGGIADPYTALAGPVCPPDRRGS